MEAQGPDGNRRQVLGLSDAKQVSDKVVATAPAAQAILPLMDGTRDLDQIVSEVGRGLTREFLEQFVAQLDDAGLLFGPRFDEIQAKMHADFDAAEVLPPGATAAFVDQILNQELGEQPTDEQRDELGAARLAAKLDDWIEQALKDAEKPSFDELPKAVVAPHIDYGRGWINYAHVWGRMRVVDRPDRVVILGTNHFANATGVCLCNKGYETPLGVCEADTELIDALREEIGQELADKLIEHRFDHEREHSVELHIPWIQHCLGKDDSDAYCPVMGVLVHDPAVNNGASYDGTGVDLQPFVDALRRAIAKLPGKTLIVSSADLSHIGPAFQQGVKPLAGDEPEAQQARQRALQHDREMLELIRQRKPEELVAAMAWQQNPTNWCSTGNLVATLRVVEPERVELLNHAAAMDQQGYGLVSHAAMVMH